ncbi:MAG TPA: hypothetical protein DCP91_13445 [Eggerthellaceae bacterium]|nr:hypothetical protein [Eggerthellaceae bacterium]
MTPSEQAAVAGIYGASAAVTVVFVLAWWVLLIIARWKIFTKAGEAGWKSIIPIYADYVQWRIGWKKAGLFWAAIALAIVGCILPIIDGSLVVNARGALAPGSSGGFLSIIALVCIIAAIVLGMMATYKLFASYGKGVGWFILYIFFPHIMLLALGFGSSQHLGPRD